MESSSPAEDGLCSAQLLRQLTKHS
jgi:hypothetical protein